MLQLAISKKNFYGSSINSGQLIRLSEQLKKPGMFRNYLGTLRHLIIS